MKLRINYDFFNAIKDVNEGFTPMKVIRNDKKILISFSFPLWITTSYLSTKSIPMTIYSTIIKFGIYYVAIGCISKFIIGEDFFKERSERNLKILVSLLKDINISTDYDLLLQSKLEERKYKIHLNESKIPELIEHKYVLVPTYNFNGMVKDVSIDQEHIVGTNEYVLSIGSPEKKLKLAYSNA